MLKVLMKSFSVLDKVIINSAGIEKISIKNISIIV